MKYKVTFLVEKFYNKYIPKEYIDKNNIYESYQKYLKNNYHESLGKNVTLIIEESGIRAFDDEGNVIIILKGYLTKTMYTDIPISDSDLIDLPKHVTDIFENITDEELDTLHSLSKKFQNDLLNISEK